MSTLQFNDSILRKDAPFRRWPSLMAAGISTNDLTLSPTARQVIAEKTKEYRAKFARLLMPKFRATSLLRASEGPYCNLDEAIAGEADCFRRRAPHKSPLRVGINLSADYSAAANRDLYAMRGAAVLALIDLCKSRGQNVLTEIAYGNGVYIGSHKCHVRINLTHPSVEVLTRVTCSSETMEQVGEKCIERALGIRWYGGYRFHEFNWQEYDFVLDRIETTDTAIEEQRILDRLAALKLT